MAKRGKLEIIKDILKVIQENRNFIKPTPLLRKSGLSSSRFKEYYNELIERQLISEMRNDKSEVHILLTENGFKFLEKYRTIVEFIDEFDL
jgi:predicted transcriptional regulator